MAWNWRPNILHYEDGARSRGPSFAIEDGVARHSPRRCPTIIMSSVNITLRRNRSELDPQLSQSVSRLKKAKHASTIASPPASSSPFVIDRLSLPSLPECNCRDFPPVRPWAWAWVGLGRRGRAWPPPPPQILSPQLQSLSSSRLIYFHYPVGADCKCRRVKGRKRGTINIGNNAREP